MFPEDHCISAGGAIDIGGIYKTGEGVELFPRATEFAFTEGLRSCERNEAVTWVAVLYVLTL